MRSFSPAAFFNRVWMRAPHRSAGVPASPSILVLSETSRSRDSWLRFPADPLERVSTAKTITNYSGTL
jgi:hypothetical protein